MTVCNIPSSFSFATKLEAIPLMKIVVPVMKYTEILLYFLLPASLLVWKVCEYVRKRKSRRNNPQVVEGEEMALVVS